VVYGSDSRAAGIAGSAQPTTLAGIETLKMVITSGRGNTTGFGGTVKLIGVLDERIRK
jgi:hypothetical protein